VKRLFVLISFAAASLAAADLKPLDEAGYKAMVAAQKGKVLMVNFWATYCVPCRKEMPAFVSLQAKYKARGLVLATVTADEPEQEAQARAFLDQTKVPAPTYVKRASDDDKFINSVDPKWSGALPLTILFDKTGRKVKSIYGEADLKGLEAAILGLL
jgi:thiol-disulfide isomerase/thioredoxin